jgi:three-Cys-motif partner protein
MPGHHFGGKWTSEKLEIVRKYLQAYTRVLKNQALNRHYIDAFAGTGDRSARRAKGQMLLDMPELDEITKGSARVAMEIEPPFHSYILIEKSKRKSSALQGVKKEFPARHIEVLNEEANEAIQRICKMTDWRVNRAVLFLDPYGMQVSWETLVAVAATKAVDVWILYPSGMGINRLMTKKGNVPKEWQDTLDRFLGSPEWRTAFYRTKATTDMFGVTTTKLVKEGDTAKFEAYFLNRLRTIFKGVAPRGVPLKNSKGQVMYLLCFACANPAAAELALKIAKSVMGI